MEGKALEVALALSRMPSMRMALRQRPLPDDVREVIELAAGSPERVALAAARSDASPSQLLEAARFYVCEVLMHEGADAYRVLGVSRGAPSEQIKAHHRALQHWLHPDRRGSDWESVYATRINIAWGELRSTERRAAYDVRTVVVPSALDAGSAPRRVLVTDWRAEPNERSQWRGWIGLGVAVAVCVWLIVLADRQASAPAPEWIGVAEPSAQADEKALPPTLDARVAAAPRPVPMAARRTSGPKSLQDAAPPPIGIAKPPAAGKEPAEALQPLRASQAQAATVEVPTPAVAPLVPRPAAAQNLAIAPVLPQPRAAKPNRVSVPVAPTQPEPASARRVQAQAEPIATMPGIDPVERVRLAYRRGGEVTRYLASTSGHAPPIWRNTAAQDEAESLRQRLDGGRTRISRIVRQTRFGDPVWRIAAERATMTATIERTGTKPETGILHVELAWHDGMWLVDAITADNLP